MGINHTEGQGKISTGRGRRTFERDEEGRLKFNAEGEAYGEISFIDFWLCGGFEGLEQQDPEEVENIEIRNMLNKTAAAKGVNLETGEGEEILFRGFEKEAAAGDAGNEITFDDLSEEEKQLIRRRRANR